MYTHTKQSHIHFKITFKTHLLKKQQLPYIKESHTKTKSIQITFKSPSNHRTYVISLKTFKLHSNHNKLYVKTIQNIYHSKTKY